MREYLFFLGIMSVLAMVLYKSDKSRAQKGKWRIKESTLLLVGILGGAAGALLAMKLFRHKTRHWYFWAVNSAALIAHLAVIYLVFIN